jgi:hypothetical protein
MLMTGCCVIISQPWLLVTPLEGLSADYEE